MVSLVTTKPAVPFKPYPDLRGMLAKYDWSYKTFADFLELSENSIALKMNFKVPFSLSECLRTRDKFREMGEAEITVDKLFVDWLSTIVDVEGSA